MIELAPEPPHTGFSFDNYSRNASLQQAGFQAPKAIKTGTTIAGIVFKDGVILGADTRATEGPIVADKNCEKIHYLTDNIYCCGAGTAADTEKTTQKISCRLILHQFQTTRPARVTTANVMLKQFLFQHQGYISAALVLGGVDETGPHLYSIYPHGSSDKLQYVSMGSGSLAAMSVFESQFKSNMTEEEGIRLVRNAIHAGIFNDLGSGSNIDICVITKKGTDYKRGYELPNEGERRHDTELRYKYPPGTTQILDEATIIEKFEIHEEVETMIVD